jgi:hypothetical protein
MSAMHDKAPWDTPELERIGHAGDAQSGSSQGDTEENVAGSVPSGPV